MTQLRYDIQGLLIDLGICTNADFGYGSFGEFEHDKYSRCTKLGIIAAIILIIVLCNRK